MSGYAETLVRPPDITQAEGTDDNMPPPPTGEFPPVGDDDDGRNVAAGIRDFERLLADEARFGSPDGLAQEAPNFQAGESNNADTGRTYRVEQTRRQLIRVGGAVMEVDSSGTDFRQMPVDFRRGAGRLVLRHAPAGMIQRPIMTQRGGLPPIY